jgi:hypothetical protein
LQTTKWFNDELLVSIVNNSLFIHIPMEIFIFLPKRGKKRGNKKRVVYVRGGSCNCVVPLSFKNNLGCPSLKRTHSYKNIPYNKNITNKG